MKSIWLMYHNVVRDGKSPEVPHLASRYHLSKSRFIRNLETIQASGHHVLSAGEWFGDESRHAIVLTFDDGWSDSFEVGVPEIRRMGWKGTFYVTRDFIGRKDFCDNQMLKDAAAEGMEIGVHGTSHRMLSGCSHDEAVREFRHCREYLEDLLGISIVHASLPGGDWNRIVISAAMEAGIESLSTSAPGVNHLGCSRMLLKRVAIKNSSSVEDVSRYCEFKLNRETARSKILQVPKSLLGMENYERVRRWFLTQKIGGR